MPTFCRHNRFIERCAICSKTLPGATKAPGPSGGATRSRPGQRAQRPGARSGGERLRVHREARAVDDGYRCELVPGLRASADAYRLVEEIAFANARLLVLAGEPPGLYAELRALAATDLERATWGCFLIAYLCPVEDGDPWVGVRAVLDAAPAGLPAPAELPELSEIPLGPLSSHDGARGTATLEAYRQWALRAAGTNGDGQAPAGAQVLAFRGDPQWSPQRRFERLFERLALPGFVRVARYELLVTLGRLGLYELAPDSLHLGGGRGVAGEDPATLAAKRVFGIGDQLLLERRAGALAQAASVPIEALDLALVNWASAQPATLGVTRERSDADAFERAGAALAL